jgi:hypothetical protein
MSAPTLADFRAFFPDDFSQASDPLVTAKLAAAVARCSEDAFGTEYSYAVLYLTAHLISNSPKGADSRGKNDDLGATSYGQEFQAIKRGHRIRGLLI